MNFKKLTAVLAATTVLCFGSLTPTYAEENTSATESTVSEVTESETKTTDDGLWEYTVQTVTESSEKYILLSKYFGNETEIVIPSEIEELPVKELGDYTFYENKIVTKITIPETLTDFGDFSFFGCSAVDEFIVDENNEIYKTVDGAIIGNDNQLYVCYPPAKPDTEYTLPDGVIAINPGAFAMAKNLKTINFPDTLTDIGYYCFSECTSLNNVVIPDSVEELGEFNFTGCTSLTDITLPDTLFTIGAGAFSFCTSLESFDFPKYIMEIGQGAFTATAMTEVEIPSTVQDIGYYAFGYSADQQGQFIEMDNFVLKGIEGSVAESYCSENSHITFEAVEAPTEAAEEENVAEGTEAAAVKTENESEGLKPGVIVAIAVAGVALLAVIIAVIVKIKRGKNSENDGTDVDVDADENYDNNDDEE